MLASDVFGPREVRQILGMFDVCVSLPNYAKKDKCGLGCNPIRFSEREYLNVKVVVSDLHT
jgi:hypothetical protein